MKRTILSILLLGLSSSAFASAPAPAVPATAPSPSPEAASPDSPRAMLQQFGEAAAGRRWDEAARFLDVRREDAAQAPELARRLSAVLEHHAAIDLNAVSGDPEGANDDGLPPGIEEVGRIPLGKKLTDPIRLIRRQMPDGTRWVFSNASLARVEAWYERLDDRWLRDHLPAPLLEQGPRGLLWWQWVAIPLLVLLSLALGWMLSWTTRKVLATLVSKTETTWDDELLKRLGGPLTLLFTLLVAKALVGSLVLNRPAEEFAHQLIKAGILVDLFWALLRTVDLGALFIGSSPWAKLHPAAVHLLPLGTRIAKLAAWAMAVIAVLSELGYPVASLLAGLGIGGLALALAAQKTVENLFGSVAITVDQPFLVGDFVRVDGIAGTVEFIGLRSTRVRTMDRTVVSIPNGKLADMRSESFGPRDRILFNTSVPLPFDTRSEQVKAIVEGIDKLLSEMPKISSENKQLVRLVDFTPTAMKVEIWAWINTTDWQEFTLLRQEALLGILAIVEKAGARVALPAQVVHTAPQRPESQGPERLAG